MSRMKTITKTTAIASFALAGCVAFDPCELPNSLTLTDDEKTACDECGDPEGCEGESGDDPILTCRAGTQGSYTKVCYEGELAWVEKQAIDLAISTLRHPWIVDPWSDDPECEHELVKYDAFTSTAAHDLGAFERVARLCWTRLGEPDFASTGDTGPVGIGHRFGLLEGLPLWNHAMPDYWTDPEMLVPGGYFPEEITVCGSVRCGLERWECRCECEADSDCVDFERGPGHSSEYSAQGICEGGLCYWDAECEGEAGCM